MQNQGIVEMLLRQFSGGLAAQLSRRLGVDEQTARRAIEMAIPLLVAALARNAQTREGAQELTGALQRDHDGSILGQIEELINNPGMAEGHGILRHTLGSQRPQVEQELSRTTGVDSSMLLEMLAPLVMGQLGQIQRQGNLDADAMADVLGNERRRVQQSSGGIADLLGQILGAGGDQQALGMERRQWPGSTEV